MAKSKGELSDLVQQLTKKGQFKKALAAMEELYAMDKKDPLVTLRMGDLCLKIGDKDGAATNYIRTAGLFAEKGHTPKAVATYKMVLRVDPSLTGIQDKIDALTGEADKPRPSFDRKNIKVDLAKEIPGLEEAAMGFPEPPPVMEPDNTPVYEIDTPVPIGSGILKKFDPKRPSAPAAPTFDTSETAPTFDISDTGGYELDTGRADDVSVSAPVFDLSSPEQDIEFGSGAVDEGGAAAVFERFGDSLDLDSGVADGGQAFENESWAPEAESAVNPFDLDMAPGDSGLDGSDISLPDIPVNPAITGMGDVTGEQALDALDALEVLDGMLEEHISDEPGSSGVTDAGGPVKHGIALFSDFSQDELWNLFGKMKRLSFKKDEKIVKEGDSGRSLFVIKSGSVRVVTKAGNAELLLARLGEREFFGEVSFLTGMPRTADVIADGPTDIMEFKREDLDEQIKSHPNLERVLKSFYEARVADTLETLKAMPRDLMQ